MFIVWLSKPINVFLTGFIRGAGLTGFLCRPWTSWCTDCYHWATRTPWSCACCWNQCDNQTILWTGSKDLPHVFLHGSPQMQPQAKATTTTALATTPLEEMILLCMASIIAEATWLDTFVNSVSLLLQEKFSSAAPIEYLLLCCMISASWGTLMKTSLGMSRCIHHGTPFNRKMCLVRKRYKRVWILWEVWSEKQLWRPIFCTLWMASIWVVSFSYFIYLLFFVIFFLN